MGTFFKRALSYCLKEYDAVYILSAKHGVLALEEVINPYNETLNGATKQYKKDWSDKVKKQLSDRGIEGDFYFYCGRNYHTYLTGTKVLEGVGGLGKQLEWITNKLKRR